MAKVFEVDFRKGSLKDRVSGTIPTNTGLIISQQEIGRAAKGDGLSYALYGDLLDVTSNFTVELWGKPYTAGTWGFISKNDDSVSICGWNLSFTASKFRFRAITVGAAWAVVDSAAVSFNRYYHVMVLVSSAQVVTMYVDNVLEVDTRTIAIESSSGNDLYIGRYYSSVDSYRLNGEIARLRIFDHELSSLERTQLYNDFLASSHITKPIVIKHGHATDMIVSLDGTNWNADGGTTNASLGNLEIATGAFRCLEDATGKYIECTTNGTLTLSGIDLSIFTGNGYLKEVLGDLSGDQGGTVDAASAFAFSSNVLTITMTAAQKLRGLTITAAA